MKKLTQRFENSSLPIALKWSVIIACFVSLVMGLLGWFLIDQQSATYRQQNEILGGVVVDQLAFAASEPLLAGDDLSLQVLVRQQEKNSLIIGMQVFDLKGILKASAGISPIGDILAEVGREGSHRLLPWRTPYVNAVSFISQITFKDVTAGYAVVSIDQGPLEKQLNALTSALLTTTLGLIALGALLAFPLSHRLCRPIYQLVKVGEAIDNGDTRHPITIGRKDEIGRVLDAFQHMARGMEKKREVEQAFSRFLSPTIAHQVLNQPEGRQLGGTTKEGSVLFCDVVGFTELSEYRSPQEVGEMLNQYFSYFSIAADSCHGTVDKFIGDCIMILFGVPESDFSHGLHAITCGVLIQEIAGRINHQRAKQGLPLVQFKIGINSGEMLAGNLGGIERMQYTVVGDAVNLSARICDICSPGEILVTEATLEQPGVKPLVKSIPQNSLKVKGRRQSVDTYRVDSESFIAESRFQESLEKILPVEVVA
ncbi:adenylate/guanylate cyclase domain-containing protein [Sedimenticola sp.]|uniref:adenylate/guanylate cyclase domain-containing protein n=1 Tax=Sedimenticola sp. TaxID=1940285 RepID=UPI003D0E7ECB